MSKLLIRHSKASNFSKIKGIKNIINIRHLERWSDKNVHHRYIQCSDKSSELFTVIEVAGFTFVQVEVHVPLSSISPRLTFYAYSGREKVQQYLELPKWGKMEQYGGNEFWLTLGKRQISAFAVPTPRRNIQKRSLTCMEHEIC